MLVHCVKPQIGDACWMCKVWKHASQALLTAAEAWRHARARACRQRKAIAPEATAGLKTNLANTGWTSVDRSTRATLNTYNTWIHLSRLQTIYHFHYTKLNRIIWIFTKTNDMGAAVPILIVIVSLWRWWTTLLSQHGFRLRGVQS